MRHRILLSVILLSILSLFGGCSSAVEDINIEGIQGKILSIDNNSILISDGVSKVNLKYSNDTVFEGKKLNELNSGDKVKTWYKSQALETNPIQATASKIEFVE